jgi:hypothetical protein
MNTAGIRIKAGRNFGANEDKWNPITLFLDSWLSEICNGKFKLHKVRDENYPQSCIYVFFENPEDATYVRLKDLPASLLPYVKIHDATTSL